MCACIISMILLVRCHVWLLSFVPRVCFSVTDFFIDFFFNFSFKPLSSKMILIATYNGQINFPKTMHITAAQKIFSDPPLKTDKVDSLIFYLWTHSKVNPILQPNWLLHLSITVYYFSTLVLEGPLNWNAYFSSREGETSALLPS